MKDKIRYGNRVIEYTIVKSKRRKTSEILVDGTGVEVRTPLVKKDSEIKKMVDDKKQWIFKKYLEFSDKINKQKIRRTKALSDKYLENRTRKLALKIGVKPSKIVVKKLKDRWGKLKDRWGSSAKNGTINLNSALKNAPPRVADYIIIHELCHLIVREHSRRYWNLVHKFMPTYHNQIDWLKENSKNILMKGIK